MQTFLPYPSFVESAKCLDWRRLGCQRKEAMQILRTLRESRKAWANHPAVLMWAGYEDALAVYINACIDEWVRRGYKNTMEKAPRSVYRIPFWLNDPAFHASHRSNLLRKYPVHYGQFGWTEPDNLEYVWPVTKEKK